MTPSTTPPTTDDYMYQLDLTDPLEAIVADLAFPSHQDKPVTISRSQGEKHAQLVELIRWHRIIKSDLEDTREDLIAAQERLGIIS